jgi:hypothetical protein
MNRTSADDEQSSEALFKEARQRRHRRRAIATATIAVVVVAAVALAVGPRLLNGREAPRNPSGLPSPGIAADRRTGATIVYAYKNLRVISADSGAARTLPLPAPQGGSSDLSMVRVGRSLVLNRGDTAWLYPPGLRGAPVDLGPSLRIIPGPIATEVWIWSDPCAESTACTNATIGARNGVVRLVDESGRQVAPPVALPASANWFPTGQSVTAGLVLAVAYGPGTDRTVIWDPRSNALRALAGYPLAAHGDWVATGGGSACPPHCSIRITYLRSGHTRRISLPPGIEASGPGAASPDGSTLAVLGTLNGADTQWPDAVIVVSLRSGAVRALPGVAAALHSAYGPPSISWSTSGWLLASRIGGSAVLAWHPGDLRMVVLQRVTLPVPHLAPPESQTEDPTLFAL